MTFDELDRLLEVEDIQMSAAEVHGILCGRLAGGERLDGNALKSALLESLATEEEMIDNAFDSLRDLYESSLAALEDESLGFSPLLPPDDAGLDKRIQALGEWCEGFISGLGDSGIAGQAALSDDAMGALRDMTAIAQVDFEGEGEEEDEADFAELMEFVRVTVMLVFVERGSLAASTSDAPRTLH